MDKKRKVKNIPSDVILKDDVVIKDEVELEEVENEYGYNQFDPKVIKHSEDVSKPTKINIRSKIFKGK